MKIYTKELCEKLAKKFKGAPQNDVNSFYHFVCSNELKHTRNRVEKWLDEFPRYANNQNLIARLTDAKQYQKEITSLAVGIGLKRCGYSVIPDSEFNSFHSNLTPDWFAERADTPPFIVEVTTINPPHEMSTGYRNTVMFYHSIMSLEHPFTLKIVRLGMDADKRFDHQRESHYVAEIDKWLSKTPKIGAVFALDQINFEVTERHSNKRVSLHGFPEYFSATTDSIEKTIQKKVKYYSNMIELSKLPFWVAVEIRDDKFFGLEPFEASLIDPRVPLTNEADYLTAEQLDRIKSDNAVALFEKLPLLSGVLAIESNYNSNCWTITPFYSPFAKYALPNGSIPEIRLLNGEFSFYKHSIIYFDAICDDRIYPFRRRFSGTRTWSDTKSPDAKAIAKEILAKHQDVTSVSFSVPVELTSRAHSYLNSENDVSLLYKVYQDSIVRVFYD